MYFVLNIRLNMVLWTEICDRFIVLIIDLCCVFTEYITVSRKLQFLFLLLYNK